MKQRYSRRAYHRWGRGRCFLPFLDISQEVRGCVFISMPRASHSAGNAVGTRENPLAAVCRLDEVLGNWRPGH